MATARPRRGISRVRFGVIIPAAAHRNERGSAMLELRPTREHSNKALPPASLEARICTYECTFCARCVNTVLQKFARIAEAASFPGRYSREAPGQVATRTLSSSCSR